MPQRVRWRFKAQRLPTEANLTLVRGQQTVKHTHQRGLARSVFTQQRVNFATKQRKTHPVVGDHTGKALGHAAEFEQRRCSNLRAGHITLGHHV